MSDQKIRIVWSDEAKADLKYIHDRILRKTKSKQNAQNVRTDIIQASKNVSFTEQYQLDKYLGDPYRRIVVRHFKVVYVPENDSSIIILEIFDSYRSPNKLRDQV